jgi:periplasmic copper chaperone A
MKKCLMIISLVAILLAGCAPAARTAQSGDAVGGITVKDAWARAVSMAMPEGGMSGGAEGNMATTAGGGMMQGTPQPGMMAGGLGNSAAYMVLVNNSAEADRLLKAESDVAGAVELHISEVKNDIMTMRQVQAIDIPAGGQVELKPGGLHVMLIGLKRPLQAGEKISLVLTFEKAGQVMLEVEVKTP